MGTEGQQILAAIASVDKRLAVLETKHDEHKTHTFQTLVDFAKKQYDQELEMKKLTANQNKFFGASSVIGLSLTAFFSYLFKNHG